MSPFDPTGPKPLVTGSAQKPGSSSTHGTHGGGGRRHAQVVSELGGLGILVNNTGNEIASLSIDCDPAELRWMLEVNIVSTALGLKSAFKTMKPDCAAGKGGPVVCISSATALIAFPALSCCSGTKSAVTAGACVTSLRLSTRWRRCWLPVPTTWKRRVGRIGSCRPRRRGRGVCGQEAAAGPGHGADLHGKILIALWNPPLAAPSLTGGSRWRPVLRLRPWSKGSWFQTSLPKRACAQGRPQ